MIMYEKPVDTSGSAVYPAPEVEIIGQFVDSVNVFLNELATAEDEILSDKDLP